MTGVSRWRDSDSLLRNHQTSVNRTRPLFFFFSQQFRAVPRTRARLLTPPRLPEGILTCTRDVSVSGHYFFFRCHHIRTHARGLRARAPLRVRAPPPPLPSPSGASPSQQRSDRRGARAEEGARRPRASGDRWSERCAVPLHPITPLLLPPLQGRFRCALLLLHARHALRSRTLTPALPRCCSRAFNRWLLCGTGWPRHRPRPRSRRSPTRRSSKPPRQPRARRSTLRSSSQTRPASCSTRCTSRRRPGPASSPSPGYAQRLRAGNAPSNTCRPRPLAACPASRGSAWAQCLRTLQQAAECLRRAVRSRVRYLDAC